MEGRERATAIAQKERSFLNGGGDMGARIRAYDWTRTPLGPPELWPAALKTAVRIMLTSRQAMWIGWGPGLTYLYNDPYKAIVGGKHPSALGQPAVQVWHEIADEIGPMLATAMRGDEGTYVEAQLLIMERNGYREETHYTFSYSPIPDDDGGTGGILCANTDDTGRVVRERQLKLLGQLAAAAAQARTIAEACEMSAQALAADPHDIPFALMYLMDPSGLQLTLAGTAGIDAEHPAAPVSVGARAMAPWPFAAALHSRGAYVIAEADFPPAPLPRGAWDGSPRQVAIVPLPARGQQAHVGLLVLGLNPYRPVDAPYVRFIDLVAAQVSTNIANANAYEDERRRADMLAELDRAKTAFFSNVSHEFRTPLTLMLGPLDDVLRSTDAKLPADVRDLLATARRNGLRLSKLVNNLLDFSRIEAGRSQANYEPTDLSALTADLASIFRSAIERVGLRLVVDCPPLPEQVLVDRDMWEKVVLNLVSNALKFTFEGEIGVHVRWRGDHVTLVVNDTGTGIAAEELPHLFERFHRVRGARSRTQEGTGIGLALVQEFVRLHNGSITARSTPGYGSTFTVSIPTSGLVAHGVATAVRPLPAPSPRAEAFVDEAVGWLADAPAHTTGTNTGSDPLRPSDSDGAEPPAHIAAEGGELPRIVLADDNADMRHYVARLLGDRWNVEAVANGLEALEAIRRHPPHVVLSDVMMGAVDGFALLQALRADPQTRHIPVVLLSARAGEEATLEGLSAGADDYLVKPFTARDLLARLEAQLLRAREREAMRDRAAIIESLINNAPLGVYLVDQDFRVAQVNPVAAPVFGDIPDLVGRDVDDVIHRLWHKEYADEIVRLFRHTLQTGESHVAHERAEFRIDRGVTEYYDWRIDRIALPDRRYGVVCYFTDVSQQVQARQTIAESEAEFRKLAENLKEANRLKDEFLATLSHELRTPLNAILGWSHMLRTRSLTTEVEQRALDALERNAKAQAQLVEELLDVSRIISGKLSIKSEPVDLGTVVAEAVETMRPAAVAKSVALHLEIDPTWQMTVTGDADRLRQVAWNLISNAVRFTPADGDVTVTVRGDGSEVELEVRDTGEGIEEAFFPYLFERFRQADSTPSRRHGGLGLGLAIVRHLAEAHGGSVRAHSAGAGHGATFTVRLPLLASVARNPVAPPARQEAPAIAGARMLIADDELDARELLQFVLSSHGAQVTAVASAGEALYALGHESFDVLIADLGMPEQDGYALIRAVRSLPEARGGAIPAIAVTAYASLREREEALAAGYNWHLAKPIETEQLIAVVATAIRKA